jgi:molybdenum cofactor cytidylyltransferase
MKSHSFAIVVLAAGGSSRLGRPKQLEPYLNKTLVEHATRAALDSGASEVVVVVGCDQEAVRQKLQDLAIKITYNAEWEQGMGGSIRCGIDALGPEVKCVIIALCDQPHITSDHLRSLSRRQSETGAPIVASSYDGVKGAPCAFSASLFPRLMELTGDSGARELIRESTVPVEVVPFDGGALDIDTPEDVHRLTSAELEQNASNRRQTE